MHAYWKNKTNCKKNYLKQSVSVVTSGKCRPINEDPWREMRAFLSVAKLAQERQR